MENITQLIHKLTDAEVKRVREFYKLNRKPNELLRLKVFETIRSEKYLTVDTMQVQLNKTFSKAALRMLLGRLQEDIMRVLILYQSHTRNVSKYYKAKHNCFKMVLEIDILMNKELSSLALIRVQQAEKLAIKYELTNERIIINEHKQTLFGFRKGLPAYNKTITEQYEVLDNIKLKIEAKDYFRRITISNLFLANKDANYLGQAKEATQQLKKLTETSNSAYIKFYYLRSEIFYNHLINNYKLAKIFANDFLEFVLLNRIVNSNDNLAGAYMLNSQISIYMGDGSDVIKFANEGIRLFTKGSLNQITLSENLFLGFILIKDYKAAHDIIVNINSFRTLKSNKFKQAKWTYYNANLLFLNEKFEDTLAILQKQNALLADRSGWRLGYKILEMMCIIEIGNYDWLDYRIETFRKLLLSVKGENILRAKAVHQIIKQFIRSGYDFKQTNSKMLDQLENLRKGEAEYKYDPMGFEVIRFDSWWTAKVNSKTKLR